MTQPRVLLYDIETAPSLGAIWGKWKQDVIWFERDWYILSVAWKWLGDPHVRVAALPDFPDQRGEDGEDDIALVEILHALFDEADIVVAHNGIKFDQRKSQARMFLQGMDPPSPYREVDTLKEARKYFSFTSNRLDDLCEALGLGNKAETGGSRLWRACMTGNPEAWALMKEYNQQDVVLLEKLYLRIRPWIKNHPAMNLGSHRDDDDVLPPALCPRCGQPGPFERRGWKILKVCRARQFLCQSCKSFIRVRLTTRDQPEYTY